jgi:hypothetical protein
MIRYMSVAALLAVGATIAYAQGAGGAAAIKERQAAMKAISGANKGLTQMAKGDAPFDAAKAAAALNTIAAKAAEAKGLFPDNSKVRRDRCLAGGVGEEGRLPRQARQDCSRRQIRRRQQQGCGELQGRAQESRGELWRLPQGLSQTVEIMAVTFDKHCGARASLARLRVLT